MSINILKKKEELKILFGIKLHRTEATLIDKIVEREKAFDALKEAMGINPKRYVDFAYGTDNNGIDVTILVVYDNLFDSQQTKKERMTGKEIDHFNFNIYTEKLRDVYGYNIESFITSYKNNQ